MNRTASRLLSRLAALGLLIAVCGLLGATVVGPLANHFGSLRNDITRQRELLARFQGFAARRGQVEAEAERSQAAIQSGMFLSGETDALRTANLQETLTEIAAKHRIRLSSVRGVPPQEEGELRLVGVQAELTTDLASLQALILALEAHRPFLFVRSLNIAPAAGRRPGGDALRIRLGIFGATATGEIRS